MNFAGLLMHSIQTYRIRHTNDDQTAYNQCREQAVASIHVADSIHQFDNLEHVFLLSLNKPK